MAVDIGKTENGYWSRRAPGANPTIRIVKESPITEQSPLDVFLTARFRLNSLLKWRIRPETKPRPD